MVRKLSKAYLLTKVLTASKPEIVVYLYEGAISHLQQAGEAWRGDHRDRAFYLTDRTISILVELSGSLNYAVGNASLAARLDAIYNYLIESLTLAKRRDDPKALETCEGILVILHGAWQEAVHLTRNETAPSEFDTRLQISA